VTAHVAEGRWARLVALAFLLGGGGELLTLPADFFSGYAPEHRYGLSNQDLPRWLWRKVKVYLVGGLLGLPLLLGLYALLWYGGAWWWLLAAAGWLGVTLGLGQLLPV